MEGVILETTQKLLRRIQQAGEIGSIMSLDLVFRATTCDIITGYCFGLSSGYIDHEDYNKPYFDGFDALFNMSWPMTYISWLGPLMDMISASVMGKFNPNLKAIWDMHAVSPGTRLLLNSHLLIGFFF